MPRADAASMTFSATGTNPVSGGNSTALSATAVFDNSIAGKLTLTLTNTGPGASAPSDVLTGIFWDYAGSPLTNLTLSSAKAPTVITNNVTTGTNVDLTKVGGNKVEWGFAKTTASTGLGGVAGVANPVTQHYGIGTAGFGINPGFGLSGGQQFNYGIITGYDNNANPAVSGGTFVKNSATFVFSGLPTGFDLTKIQNLRFQYGTALNEPSTYYIAPPPPPKKVPEPSTAVALGLFAVGALKVAKKKTLVSA
ncbi:PEP-CTERM sorting domain-containing protein [Nostoc sp. FACHB-973]|nr:PEP-CTERM sorting domain-containing protein [Nostoc sp. FACHB-973]